MHMPQANVALVTGGGSGLGRAVATTLLAAGWRVAVAGRREQPLHETAATGDWPAGPALAVVADVTVPESVDALFGAVRDQWGRLDLLVNNAGVFGPGGAVDELSLDQW